METSSSFSNKKIILLDNSTSSSISKSKSQFSNKRLPLRKRIKKSPAANYVKYVNNDIIRRKSAILASKKIGNLFKKEALKKKIQVQEENSDESDEKDEELHCICQRPSGNMMMIQCEKCQAWFHCPCVGISAVECKILADADEDLNWFCGACRLRTFKDSSSSK